MSTTFKPIEGLKEIPHTEIKESEYKPTQLHVSTFWGGNIRGKSLQLSIGNEHIQLDNNAARKLIMLLQGEANL